jgi:hypothetical protein
VPQRVFLCRLRLNDEHLAHFTSSA